MRKKISIAYLSHGIFVTGAYLHEETLISILTDEYRKRGYEVEEKCLRTNRLFRRMGHLKFVYWCLKNTCHDINIVGGRIALYAVLRNLWLSKKVLIVLHNFDRRDGKSLWMKVYYGVLFALLTYLKLRNVAVIAVSAFWQEHFVHLFKGNVPVMLFPNMFNTSKYVKLRVNAESKHKKIHLGQFGEKNDPRIFVLARELSRQGYYCYFSTMRESEAGYFQNYEIVYKDHNAYLQQMAVSKYTLAFTAIREGWNRVAHESILVGTPVIGVRSAGLGDLLLESGSLAAGTAADFLHLIGEEQHRPADPKFIEMYDLCNASCYTKPILRFAGCSCDPLLHGSDACASGCAYSANDEKIQAACS